MKQENNKNRNKTAVALGYDPGTDVAPKIIATGRGVLADKILDVAKESQIPIHKDERLASTLSKLELGDAIPKELYEVVSEILVFVDRMDRIKSKVLPRKDM
ncbi:flagellar biosynthesis protein [Mobilisporobacter senegalensis]|uniref:Flagellar biosynthesis protein n=1 Tax=Mobilisporobacter senegalensis TaxID=1329262 RepID=A0A3N1XW28_9FIRM|nr:EscU/YscU/HrcU family type III secretion system export apparatus switch protein [Mobilisporobacter senegalensis]ROR29392.1 flagellar biosynthesis protein [Mobilisporobacter senegalensis]